jgi:hypothetical protein
LASSLIPDTIRSVSFSLASKILAFRSGQIDQHMSMMSERIPFNFADVAAPVIFSILLMANFFEEKVALAFIQSKPEPSRFSVRSNRPGTPAQSNPIIHPYIHR